MQINDIVRLECISINNYAKGVSKIDSLLVFIDDMYPGEVADVRITKIKKNLCFGEVINFIKKSDRRIENECNHIYKYGTCPFSNIEYSYELELKKQIVLNNINHYTNSNILDCNIYSGDKIKGYRNKVTVFFDEFYNYGSFIEGTNTLDNISNCITLDDKMKEIIEYLLYLLKNKNIPTSSFTKLTGLIKGAVIRRSEYTSLYSILILSTTDDERLKDVSSSLHLKFKELNGIMVNINKEYDTFIYKGKNHLYFGTNTLDEKLNDVLIKCDFSSFLQVNTSCASKLYKRIQDIVYKHKPNTIVDLYCGCGGISLNASKYTKTVYGIEEVKSSISYARTNAIINNINNCFFYVSDASNYRSIIKNKKIDLLILDPPRSGLSTKLLDTILNDDIEYIIYVSCDSYTLSKDLKLLNTKYSINLIELYNMFPRSKHCEVLTLLNKKID